MFPGFEMQDAVADNHSMSFFYISDGVMMSEGWENTFGCKLQLALMNLVLRPR